MIGQIRGILIEKQPPNLLVDVQGVGYEIEAPMSTFYNLGDLNSEVRLFTHLVVRDDAHLLFGFFSSQERRLFRTLIKVNGVGAKMALTILSGISSSDFALCVQSGDVTTLTRLPGIGKKTAERLIVEMRDKLVSDDSSGASSGIFIGDTQQSAASGPPAEQAVAALVSLGYKAPDAIRMVRAVTSEAESTEDIIRLALKSTVVNR